MKWIIFFLLWTGIANADPKSTIQFPADSEFFILARNQTSAVEGSLFLMPINSHNTCNQVQKAPDPLPKGVWVNYSSRDPAFRFLDNNNFDRVSFETADMANAAYVKTRKPLVGTIDDKKFGEITSQPGWDKQLFGDLEKHVPLSGLATKLQANDLDQTCPKLPQRKDGKPCDAFKAIDLPPELKQMIQNSARKFHVPPALIASIMHNETNFDLFIENQEEKKICEENGGSCSSYKWGRSFAQLGVTDAPLYGVDWNKFISPPSSCAATAGKGQPVTSQCLQDMDKICASQNGSLRPINCPAAAVDAVAQKLATLIPSDLKTVLSRGKSIKKIDLTSVLTSDEITEVRNRAGLYNRGPRVYNGYAEYYRKNGKFPANYGEAWSATKTCDSPSDKIGYRVLRHEFINRCYVWRVAGLCGGFPKTSLMAQYTEVFQNQVSSLQESKPGAK